VWALINDRMKLLAYRVLDHFEPETKAAAKIEAKPEDEVDDKENSKVEAKPDDKPDPKVEAEAKPGPKVDTAKLLSMTLGEALLAGLIKDLEEAPKTPDAKAPPRGAP
jgi:hypothetical protein